jgi:T3SS negative regulator,GrlR
MALEALWIVTFTVAARNWGGGIVVFETERIFGGDPNYFYVGSYKAKGNDITADVAIIHHAGPYNKLFGPVPRVDLAMKGTRHGKSIHAEGAAVHHPSLKVRIQLKHLQDLPGLPDAVKGGSGPVRARRVVTQRRAAD